MELLHVAQNMTLGVREVLFLSLPDGSGGFPPVDCWSPCSLTQEAGVPVQDPPHLAIGSRSLLPIQAVGAVRVVTLFSCPEVGLCELVCQGWTVPLRYSDARNPDNFPAILAMYRTGQLHTTEGGCALVLQQDLQYWDIDDMTMEPCQ